MIVYEWKSQMHRIIDLKTNNKIYFYFELTSEQELKGTNLKNRWVEFLHSIYFLSFAETTSDDDKAYLA